MPRTRGLAVDGEGGKTRAGRKRKSEAVATPEKSKQPATTDAIAPQKKRIRNRGRGEKDSSKETSDIVQDEEPTSEFPALPQLTAIDDEELELEELVFGGDIDGRMSDLFGKAGKEAVTNAVIDDVRIDEDDVVEDAESEQSGDEAGMGFFLDTGNNSPEPAERNHVTIDLSDNEEQEEEQSEISTLDLTDPSNLPPAWEDDDTHVSVNISDAKRLRKLRTTFEENTISGKEYELRLRKQFEKLHPTPNWAVRPFREQHTGDTVNDLQRILRTTSSIIDTTQSRRTLNPDNLEVVRLKDANQAAYSQSVVQSVKFHPRAPVLLTAGYDRTVRLFQVDGKINPRIQSIYIKDLPIHRANFTPDGKEVLLTGKRNFFYSYNIEASSVQRIPGVRGQDETSYASSYMSPDNKHIAFLGRDGHIVLISRETKQWIATMKMNGSATSMDFSDDGQTIFSFGGDGEVYQWDIGSRKCIHKFVDEGCVKATTLAVSSGSRFIATGNESGVVNLYDHDKFSTASNPTPRKSILNLTTSITTMQFNRDSQILALASREKKDSLRLFHVPSQRIFKNWPTSQTPLGYVNCLDFSPGGGYLAIGNDKGKALLYRLSAYSAM